MKLGRLIGSWPLLRQADGDPLGLGRSVRSEEQAVLHSRTEDAEHVVKSVCPYCAVGCGQLVHVRNGKIDQIEGDPDSPISRGRLCPKGAATKSLVTSPFREYRVKYQDARPRLEVGRRKPGGRGHLVASLPQPGVHVSNRMPKGRIRAWRAHDAVRKSSRIPSRGLSCSTLRAVSSQSF